MKGVGVRKSLYFVVYVEVIKVNRVLCLVFSDFW